MWTNDGEVEFAGLQEVASNARDTVWLSEEKAHTSKGKPFAKRCRNTRGETIKMP